jgi:HEAT repeat protein
MVIEWAAVMGGAAMKAAASSAAGKMAGMLVEKGKAKIFPGELEKAIAAGILAAKAEDETCSPSDHLFYRCYENDRDALLAKAIEHSVMLAELRKPLEGEGLIDVACLVKVFELVAGELKLELVWGSLERWVTTFAEGYREATAASIRFQVAKEQYLKQLAHRVDDVKFVGIAVSGQEVEKQEVLAQIFVMPDVREEKKIEKNSLLNIFQGIRTVYELKAREVTQTINYSKPADSRKTLASEYQTSLINEQRSWATRDRSGPRIPAQKVLTQSKNKAVLLGAPGSGKTTLASYFALMLCGQVGNDPTQIGLEVGQDWLPVVIRIRDWVLKPELSLLKYLRWYAEESLSVKVLPIGFFEHWLERGWALILLDGLDEVVDEAQRRSVVEEIETFLGQYEHCPAVITSRPAGYRWDFFNLEAFPHYTLEPFDDKQVDTFIDHWYDSRELDQAAAKRRKEDLRSAFKGNDRIRNLATNPLLLTIIALIHRYQAELPRRRFKLYESAVETLLTSWDSGKEMKLYGVLEYLKADDLLYVLKKLAYWIHTQGSAGETDGGTLIETDELKRQLRQEIKLLKRCESHEAKAEADRFVSFIQRRTGLLNEQGKDRYAFVHKTFQEYLTAEEIYDRFEEGEDEAIVEHIQAHLHDPHWREVLLLLVSKLKKKRAARAIEVVLKAGSEYEKWLKRDLLFAGWCLTEDPEGLKTVAEGLVGEILDGLVAIEVGDIERNGDKAREESTEIIKRLGGTVFEGNIWERLKSEEGASEPFRLLEFQASLGQEGEAIETLLTLLKNDDSEVRCRAASGLGQLGNASPEVVSGLLNLLKDGSSAIRIGAASQLTTLSNLLGNTLPEVVHELLSLLKDDDSHVRSFTAMLLGLLGNASLEVVSGLLNALKEDNFVVASIAANSLVQLVNASPEVVSELLHLLKRVDCPNHCYVESALVQLGNASSEVVSGLLKLLKDDDSAVRSSAASGLGQLENASSEVMSGLLKLLKDDDSAVRSSAASGLGQLGNASSEVVSGLLKLLKDDDSAVRSSAASGLGQLENASSEIMSELLKLPEGVTT